MRIDPRPARRAGALLVAGTGALLCGAVVVSGAAPAAVPDAVVASRAAPAAADSSVRASVPSVDAAALWVWPTGRGWSNEGGKPPRTTTRQGTGHRRPRGARHACARGGRRHRGVRRVRRRSAGRDGHDTDGLVSTLDSVTPTVTAGDTVVQGEVVGAVAAGHCPASAPCLHLGARVDGRYVDPTPYLPAAAWPVLLPDSAWTG